QFQFNVLLLLIPILLIMGLSELIHGLAFRWLEESDALLVSQFGTFGSGMLVFLFAPLLAKVLFSTQRLADGELRDDLLAIGARHRVNVRDLLLWKTDGTMINAAVMGLIAPLRYVLITDALIESMRTDEVRAVMAHEIGHVKRHHIPWMVLCLIALLAISDYLVVTPIVWMMGGWEELSTDIELWVDMALSAGILVTVLLGFGWVSRRFERQADTFAAQHLSGMAKPGERSSGEAWVITQDAVNSLQRALLTICRLHSVDPNRRSWRHGSISWRVEYLQSIVGKSIRGLRIDRIIIRIKLGALACVLMAVAYESSVAFPAVESVPDQESVQTRSSEAATLDDTEPETP
ncbi:MAG: M48 family metallopeptidase, partial [Planctomycetota bacterium]|nr:M48 family metallopeptidase [Planctomycetota bacterium]